MSAFRRDKGGLPAVFSPQGRKLKDYDIDSASSDYNPAAIYLDKVVAVTTCTDSYGTMDNRTKKLFTAVGRLWFFYWNGSNQAFRTSTDGGLTWSSETTLGTIGNEYFDVFYDSISGNIYYAFAQAQTYFTWRYGVPQTNGTITWTIGETTHTPTNNSSVKRPCIKTDSAGNVFVAIECKDGSNYVHIEVDIYTGTWTNASLDFNSNDTGADWAAALFRFTSGKMCILLTNINGGTAGRIIDYSGAAWGTPIDISGDTRCESWNGSGDAIGDTMYWVGFQNDTTDQISYFSHDYGSGSVPSQTAMNTLAGYIRDGTGGLATDGNKTFVAVYASLGGYRSNALYARVSVDKGATWGPEVTIYQNMNQMLSKGLSMPERFTGTALNFAWTEGKVNPFNINLGILQLGKSAALDKNGNQILAGVGYQKQSNKLFYRNLTAQTTTITTLRGFAIMPDVMAYVARKSGIIRTNAVVRVKNDTANDGTYVELRDEFGVTLDSDTVTNGSVVDANYRTVVLQNSQTITVGQCVLQRLLGNAVTGGTSTFIVVRFEITEDDW